MDRTPTPRKASAGSPPVTVIQACPGWQPVNFAELWHYRELVYFLVWRDLAVRYKQTVLGVVWAVLPPVATMLVFSLVFGTFARMPSDGVPYAPFVFAGLLPWTLFAGAVSQAGMSLVNQSHLLTKVYVPRLLVPAAGVGISLVDFGLNLVVYGGILLWYGRMPGPSVLLLPLLIGLTIAAALGVGYVVAALTVTYRDFRFLVPFALQVWMYASPVIYPASLATPPYRTLLALNPMTGLIGGFRAALLNTPLDLGALTSSAVFAVGVLALGLFCLRRAESRMADVV